MAETKPVPERRPMSDNHGSVRAYPKHGLHDEDCIGITLAGTEHVISVDDALGLANAIILTCVDHEPRHMRTSLALCAAALRARVGR